jgi:hypothetical protein
MLVKGKFSQGYIQEVGKLRKVLFYLWQTADKFSRRSQGRWQGADFILPKGGAGF